MKEILWSRPAPRRLAFSMLLIFFAVPLLGTAQLPSGLGETPHAAADSIVYGIYPSDNAGACCWMGPAALVHLQPPPGATTLVLVFSVPNYSTFRTRSEALTLTSGSEKSQLRCCYGPGQHAALFKLPHSSRTPASIRLSARVWFVPKELGLNEDPRRLSVLIRSFEYRNDSGSLLLGTGSTIADSTIMTPLMLAMLIAVFLSALGLAWGQPIYAIVLLIILEPFGSNVSVGLTTVTLFKTALAGTLIGFAPKAPWRELWQRREVLVPILCLGGLMATAVISMLHAQYPALALREALKYFEYAVILAVSFLAYRITRDRRIAGAAFVFVAIAVCVAALAQEITGAPETAFVLGRILPRIAGPLEGPNQLAGWLEIMVPVLLCVRLQRELRFLGTFACVLAIATSVLTLSRAGMFGLVVGIVIFAFASQRAEGRRVAPFAIAAALAAVGTLAYRALPQGPVNDTFNNGLGTRSQLWHAAIVLWRSHPVTGIGAGNYETQLGRVGLIGVRTHANSWYLQSLAEGGLMMFTAVLATIYGLIVTLMQSRAMLTTAALAATAAICAHQIFDDLIFFPKVGAMWWLIVGVGLAAMSALRPDSNSATATAHSPL